ncbi:MAG: tRNA1(Val) (adenine(37)-N6)-methyltransferase [Hyphomonadaceae bacterium]
MTALEAEFTEDSLLGGRVRLRQPRGGFRANADTLLLAAAVTAGARLMEAGCGAGGALLSVAARHPSARLTGVERDPAMAALARENLAANGFAGEIVAADILDRAALEGVLAGVFDGIFCNPPFDAPGRGRPPAEARRAAHVADAPIGAWIKALADRLRGGGALTLIHRAEALGEILAALEGRLGGARALPVHPRAAAPAKRVLVRAVKGSRAPLAILPGLVLHEGEHFTPQAEAIFRGEAAIEWG